MQGTVKNYRVDGNFGYGFVLSDGTDYYFTSRDWKDKDEPFVGAKVTFNPVKNSRGLRAKDVKGD